MRYHKEQVSNMTEYEAELPNSPLCLSAEAIAAIQAENERVRREKEVKRMKAYRERKRKEDPEGTKAKQRAQSARYRAEHREELNSKARERAREKKAAMSDEERLQKEYDKLLRRNARLQASLAKYNKGE